MKWCSSGRSTPVLAKPAILWKTPPRTWLNPWSWYPRSNYWKDISPVSLSRLIELVMSPWDPFYQHRLTLILAWISNHMLIKVQDEITFPFPTFRECTVAVWEWMNNLIPYFMRYAITYAWYFCETMLVKGAPGGYWGGQRMGNFLSNKVTTSLLQNRYLCYVLVPISKWVAVTSTRITKHPYTGPNNDNHTTRSIHSHE